MADSEDSRILPFKTRRNILSAGGAFVIAAATKQAYGMPHTPPENGASLLALWRDWNSAYRRRCELTALQRQLEAKLSEITDKPMVTTHLPGEEMPLFVSSVEEIEQALPGIEAVEARNTAVERRRSRQHEWNITRWELGYTQACKVEVIAGMAGEAHWNEEAKALIAGLILYLAAVERGDRRNLATLREYLTLAPEAFSALLKDMQASTAASGLIARAANRHLGKSDREAAGVLSAAQRHTHFLDSPRMVAVLGRSDFGFSDLKRRNVSVFLVLPPDRPATYSRWLRLLVSQSLIDMARDPAKPAAPVLYLLDEFAALGHLAPVERAMGLMAGYGVQLWPILQEVHQLRATCGQRASTFLSNAGVLQVFGVNDHDSARLISDLLGQETVVFQTMSRGLDAAESGITYGEQHIARALLTPDEVRNLPQNLELLFLAGQRPIVAGKLAYYADPEFRGLYDAA
ncbi:Ti-type conjugative transfer system protein TraG [Shinella sp. DD12]|nr:Ti-type conjugative transfer system protein TraG [Shinella sp. DD12]